MSSSSTARLTESIEEKENASSVNTCGGNEPGSAAMDSPLCKSTSSKGFERKEIVGSIDFSDTSRLGEPSEPSKSCENTICSMRAGSSEISFLFGLRGDVIPALSAAIDGSSSGLSWVEPVMNLLGFRFWVALIVSVPSPGDIGIGRPQADGLVDD